MRGQLRRELLRELRQHLARRRSARGAFERGLRLAKLAARTKGGRLGREVRKVGVRHGYQSDTAAACAPPGAAFSHASRLTLAACRATLSRPFREGRALMVDRRQFLRYLGVTAVAAAASGCKAGPEYDLH